ncbi:MAG: agmatine deiminase family protein [Bacteroidales bacterium]|nr:agmatine deiminase family protein [Bacteroidales bacterium]
MRAFNDHVWFSSLFAERFPETFSDIIKIMSGHKIKHDLLEMTKDVWIRDFMPVRRSDGRYLLFNYDPSYLKPHWQHLKTSRRDIIRICEKFELDFIDMEEIILDGGNVIAGSQSVIITDDVFRENGIVNDKLNQVELMDRLASYFDSEIIIIPHQPGDILGHADGLVRFLDAKTVIVNDFASDTNKKFIESITFLKTLFHKLENKGLDIIPAPYAPQEGKTKDGIPVATGIYINYLETTREIFLPQFGENLQDKDAEALHRFKEIFRPEGKTIVPVKCTDIAKEGGVLNCVSWN